LASKLVGWDIEIMTNEELDESLARAEGWFSDIPGVSPEMIEAFITEGFLSYRDLTFFEPTELAEMTGITQEAAEEIIDYAEQRADEIEEQEEERIAHEKEAARQAKLAGIERPVESTAKQAFESLFAAEPAAPSSNGEVQPQEQAEQGEAAADVSMEPPTEQAEEPAPEATVPSSEGG
jgi:N utilization substance protein A